MPTYLIHPLAERFPPMQDEEYQALKKSLQENGFRTEFPVLLWQNMVLDGRHRYRACQELGIDPYCVTWHGTEVEAVNFVLLANAIRRSLTASQRAACLALFCVENPNQTVAEAAELAHVSKRTMDFATRVAKEAPEQLDSVVKGEKTLNQVVSKLPPKPSSKLPPKPKPEKTIPNDEGFDDIINTLHAINREIADMAKEPAGRMLRTAIISRAITDAVEAIKWGKPYRVCPYTTCKTTGCAACGGSGWVTKNIWDNVPADIRGDE